MSEPANSGTAGEKKDSVPAKTGKRPETAHFWICTAPFFETTLLSASLPPASLRPPAGATSQAQTDSHVEEHWTTLRFFDADGMLFNEATLHLTPGQVSIVELDPLMGACKFESGLKHARLEVTSAGPARHLCRIHTREGAALTSELLKLSGTRRLFLPFSLNANSLTFMPLVNLSSSEALVRARLFLGSRSPEMVWTIRPNAIKLVNLENEFADYMQNSNAARSADARQQGYLRLSVRGEYTVGFGALEQIRGVNGGNYFTSIG